MNRQRNKGQPMLMAKGQKRLAVETRVPEVTKQLVKENTFNFVKARDVTHSAVLKAARQLIEDMNYGFSTKEIEEEKILKKLSKKDEVAPGIFVLEMFSGEIFERLCKKKVRIIGPLTILQTEGKRDQTILMAEDIPIKSQYMRNRTVTISSQGLKADKKVIHKYVQRMGGVATKVYTTKVNMVIADDLTSEKCKLAREQGNEIYLSQLAMKCWNLSEKNELVDVEKMLWKYRIPVFHNFKISISGVSHS